MSSASKSTKLAAESATADLMNVDYEDVLHLYRGWRKSESALKEKNKELAQLRNRITTLQDSHIKFRGQIQSLQSVKELTIGLQRQISVLQEENASLKTENRELSELNTQAETLLRERMEVENSQNKALRNIQLDFDTLRGKYEEMSDSQRELETLAADEQAMRMAAEARLVASEDQNDKLRIEIKSLKIKLDTLSIKSQQLEQELTHASEQLSSMGREIATLSAMKEKANASDAEIGVLKGDIARLLRLLEHYPAARGFLIRWQQSEGLSFIGAESATDSSTSKLNRMKMKLTHDTLDVAEDPTSIDEMTDGEAWAYHDMSPAEIARLKKLHNGDPFKMTDNFGEESDMWVPQEAASMGMRFLTSKIPHAPPNVIMDFLRKMNKIWIQREKRKLNDLKEEYEKKMDDLKRRANHARPYRRVITEKQIKRLRNQIREERMKNMQWRPRKKTDMVSYGDEDMFLLEDAEVDSTPHERRHPCKAGGAAFTSHCGGSSSSETTGQRKASIKNVSTEKLLEASLMSLETIGRQRSLGAHPNTALHARNGSKSKKQGQPTEEYIRGATWLGRNLAHVTEELSEAMDCFRAKYMAEVSAAANDNDEKRAVVRLNLLAGSGMSEAVSLTNNSKMKIREILKGVTSLHPGDSVAYEELLLTLPLDSAIANASPKIGLSAYRFSPKGMPHRPATAHPPTPLTSPKKKGVNGDGKNVIQK